MNKQLRHAMIDIETMGTTPDCAIVSIGGVIFDPRYGKVSDDTIYVELDWRNQGRRICPETADWWKQQGQQARKALNGNIELEDALDNIEFWLPDDVKVWANGPTFDISFLEHAYQSFNMEVPWKFWNARCMRTIKDMYESQRGGLSRAAGGVKHNALDDAVYQAKAVCHMWNKILGGE